MATAFSAVALVFSLLSEAVLPAGVGSPPSPPPMAIALAALAVAPRPKAVALPPVAIVRTPMATSPHLS